LARISLLAIFASIDDTSQQQIPSVYLIASTPSSLAAQEWVNPGSSWYAVAKRAYRKLTSDRIAQFAVCPTRIG